MLELPIVVSLPTIVGLFSIRNGNTRIVSTTKIDYHLCSRCKKPDYSTTIIFFVAVKSPLSNW